MLVGGRGGGSGERDVEGKAPYVVFLCNCTKFLYCSSILCCHLICETSDVSETIRKAPLAEAQTASGKRNTFLGRRKSVQLPKFREKTASPPKISLKSAKRLLSYGQKRRILKWRSSAILNFRGSIMGSLKSSCMDFL